MRKMSNFLEINRFRFLVLNNTPNFNLCGHQMVVICWKKAPTVTSIHTVKNVPYIMVLWAIKKTFSSKFCAQN